MRIACCRWLRAGVIAKKAACKLAVVNCQLMSVDVNWLVMSVMMKSVWQISCGRGQLALLDRQGLRAQGVSLYPMLNFPSPMDRRLTGGCDQLAISKSITCQP